MLTKRFVKCIILMATVLLSVASLPLSALAQSDAAGAISSAKQQIVVCFESVRQAEAAGANVSILAYVLIGAGDLLSRSELAYSRGDFGVAQNLAVQCSQRISQVVSEADSLRVAAVERRDFVFWVYFVGSIVGMFVVILVGLGVWLFVKRRYVRVGGQTAGSA